MKQKASKPTTVHLRRAAFYARLYLFAMVVCFATSASAAPVEENLPPAVDRAVMKGLDFLERQQQPDGSFTGFDEQGPRIEPAAQALLAYLSAGQTPAVGRHALATRNTLDFIVRQLPDDGDFARADGSGWVGQATITIALSEVYGLDTDPARRILIREALKKSLGFILASQDARSQPRSGGWHDGGGEGHLATTFWIVLSLHALKDAGFDVPADSFQRAALFVKETKKEAAGAYANHDAAATPLTNAAGIAVLAIVQADSIPKEPIKFLAEHRIGADTVDVFPAQFVLTFAAMKSGEPAWSAQWKPTREMLLARQAEDGSWYPPKPPPVGLGNVPATCVALMTLAVPNHLLPLYGK